MIQRGANVMGTSTGPLPRQQGHLALTVTLHGAKELVDVFAQAPKYVTSTALRICVTRGVKVVQDSIRDQAAAIPSERSFGVYSRSLANRVDMGGRFTAVGTVGNKRDYREGPYAREAYRRRPAKYWHFVEWGVRGGRGHHVLHRAVMKALPKLKRTLEAASIEVLSRHFKVPPLRMAHLVATGGPLPQV